MLPGSECDDRAVECASGPAMDGFPHIRVAFSPIADDGAMVAVKTSRMARGLGRIGGQSVTKDARPPGTPPLRASPGLVNGPGLRRRALRRPRAQGEAVVLAVGCW